MLLTIWDIASRRLWAPMSELFGRKNPILISSFGFSIFSIAVATGKDVQTVFVRYPPPPFPMSIRNVCWVLELILSIDLPIFFRFFWSLSLDLRW